MTIAGQHTDAEVRELLTEKDSEIQQTKRAYDNDVAPIWAMQDADANREFKKDLDGFLERWDFAKLRILTNLGVKESAARISGGIAGAVATSTEDLRKLIPAEGDWDTLLTALKKGHISTGSKEVEGPFQKGDFADLTDRLAKITSELGLEVQIKIKQPDEIDIDLDAFQAADKVTRKVDKVADKATSPVTLVAVGAGLAVGGYLALKFLRL